MSKELKLCRFCANWESLCISIFSADGVKNHLIHKIRVCAPINVTESDTLPKNLCLNCISSLDQVYDFYQKIKSSQLKLKDLLQDEENDESSHGEKRSCSSPDIKEERKKFCFGNTTIRFNNCGILAGLEASNSNSGKSDCYPPLNTYVRSEEGHTKASSNSKDQDFKIPDALAPKGNNPILTEMATPDNLEASHETALKPVCHDKKSEANKKHCDSNLISDFTGDLGVEISQEEGKSYKEQAADRSKDFAGRKDLRKCKQQNRKKETVVQSQSVKLSSQAGKLIRLNPLSTKRTQDQCVHDDITAAKKPSESDVLLSQTVRPSKEAVSECQSKQPSVQSDDNICVKSAPESPIKQSVKKKSSTRSNTKFKKCRHCEKEFREDILLQHEKLHYGEPVFTCAECDGFFFHAKSFESHQCNPSN